MGIFDRFVSTARVLIAIASLVAWAPSAHAQSPELFAPANQLDATPEQSRRISALRAQPTAAGVSVMRINVDVLRGPGATITVPGQRSMSFSTQSVEAGQGQNFVWHGQLPNVAGTATLVVRNGNVTGTVQDNASLYHIEPLGAGLHALVAVDASRFPPDDDPANPEDEAGRQKPQPLPDAAPMQRGEIVEIDVLVAYTPAAKAAVADIDATIQLAMAEANQSFAASAVHIRFKLADSFELPLTEGGRPFPAILDEFIANPEMLRRRSATAANLTALIINQVGPLCGQAKEVVARPETAFAVVHYGCATGNYTFAHELGHLIGARHNESADASTVPFAYGHGFMNLSGPAWRTIMSYNCPQSCPRLPYWSNPHINLNAIPMGTAETNDNARVLNERALIVAGFNQPVMFGDWLLPDNGEVLTIREPSLWLHPKYGEAVIRRDETGAADIKVFYRSNKTSCLYRTSLTKTGQSLILTPVRDNQDPDYCPMGDLQRVRR